MASSLDTGDGRACALDYRPHRAAAPVALLSCHRCRVMIAARTALNARGFASTPRRVAMSAINLPCLRQKLVGPPTRSLGRRHHGQ